MSDRHYSAIDRVLIGLQQPLETLFNDRNRAQRPYPTRNSPRDRLGWLQRRHAAGLMRVNHAGEVSAQALYQGQALTARNDEVRQTLSQAAEEEQDHLAWCQYRLRELGSRASRLGPFWYAGSFTMGATAGLMGDRVSLGFVAETERQVVEHLSDHLERLPEDDARSRAIVAQMQIDERNHGATATRAGGITMPAPVRSLMRLTSRVMVHSAYWL